MAVKDDFWYRFSLVVVPPVYGFITRLLFGSCRIIYQNRDIFINGVRAPEPCIVAFWHYSLFYIIHDSGWAKWAAMVSGSKDGEYIARVLAGKGVTPVRGSRTRRGIGALREMEEAMKNGMNAALVADGSQGPPRIAQAGMIFLASRTGAPIIPMAWGADRYWTFRSWDRTVLPKPFARISMFYDEPFMVPPGLKSKELEKYRLELEERLNRLYEKAWGVFGKKEH